MRVIYLLILLFFYSCTKSQVTVNESGTTVDINGLGGSAITINTYFPPLSGDITFTDSHFQFAINGYAKTGFTARNPGAFVEIETTETSLDIKVAGDWVGHATQSDCEVIVNGVWNQSVRVTVEDEVQSIPITLPPGEKVVRLISGYAANQASGQIILPASGVHIQGVVTTGVIRIKKPVSSGHKKVFFGDSITDGASGTHPLFTGFSVLFRTLDNWAVQLDCWGARAVVTTNSTLGNTLAAYLSPQLNGTISNELFICLGTNNYGLLNQSKATFKAYYEFMLDAIIAARPDVTIYCVSMLNRQTYDTGNSGGAFGDDYADAIEELVSTRPTTRFIYGKPLVSLSNMSDGAQLHPNQTGMQQYHDNLLAAYNLLAYVPRPKLHYVKGMYVDKSGELKNLVTKRKRLKYSIQ